MISGKAVEEVLEWRVTFEEELNKIPRNQQVKFINDSACRALGIECRMAKCEPVHGS